jgi:hypothetical protein
MRYQSFHLMATEESLGHLGSGLDFNGVYSQGKGLLVGGQRAGGLRGDKPLYTLSRGMGW